MKFECPECKRTIFNRRLKTCEFCSAEIPIELQYSEQDKKQIEDQYYEILGRKCEIEGVKGIYGHGVIKD